MVALNASYDVQEDDRILARELLGSGQAEEGCERAVIDLVGGELIGNLAEMIVRDEGMLVLIHGGAVIQARVDPGQVIGFTVIFY
ncbi:MAG: hypothetical protein OSB69_17635 [Alphaproteobacteria bacterium]|nr:hypothetical protein [Alphaproteobacteria bacterium]